MLAKPRIWRLTCLAASLILIFLLYEVYGLGLEREAGSLSVTLGALLFLCSSAYILFVDGDWRHKPLYSPDYFVPAIGQITVILLTLVWVPDAWRVPALVLEILLIPTLDVFVLPRIRQALGLSAN